MSDLELATNCLGLAWLLRKQVWLWVAPERSRVELQDKMDRRLGPNSKHAQEAEEAMPGIKLMYFLVTSVWLILLVNSL